MKLDYELKENHALFTVNVQFFSLDIVYAAAYIMIKDAYIVFDGDVRSTVLVYIKPKISTKTPEELAIQFHDELLNFSVYRKQAEHNKDLRRTFLQRALLTAEKSLAPQKQTEALEDPEGIAIPWEEKYGKTSHQHT